MRSRREREERVAELLRQLAAVGGEELEDEVVHHSRAPVTTRYR